ncbi:MAG: hypothetical protein Q8880_08225 [Bacteroidota bacterium]|nr:hypothetical protein [Bacteroidota bacterium]
MFRTFFNIIIAIFICIPTIGISVNAHYCGNELASVSFLQKSKDCGCHCPACHNKAKYIKIKDSYQNNQSYNLIQNQVINLDNFDKITPDFLDFSISAPIFKSVKDCSPPGEAELFVLYRVFLI